MEKNAVLGELLYKRFNYEKGCFPSSEIWKPGYRKSLINHLQQLKPLCEELGVKELSGEEQDTLKHFFKKVKENKRVSIRYYNRPEIIQKLEATDFNIITEFDPDKYNPLLPRLMNDLVMDSLAELDRPIKDKPRIAHLLRALHNLPLYCFGKYEGEKAETPYMTAVELAGCSPEWALELSLQNMDLQTRRHYKHYKKDLAALDMDKGGMDRESFKRKMSLQRVTSEMICFDELNGRDNVYYIRKNDSKWETSYMEQGVECNLKRYDTESDALRGLIKGT